MTNELIKERLKQIPEINSFYYNELMIVLSNKQTEYPLLLRELRTRDEYVKTRFGNEIRKHETFLLGIITDGEPDIDGVNEECLENYALSIFRKMVDIFVDCEFGSNLKWYRRGKNNALVLEFTMISKSQFECEEIIEPCLKNQRIISKRCECKKNKPKGRGL